MGKRVKVIKADCLLKDKVGSGNIDEKTIQKCNHIVANNGFDFAPHAKSVLDRLYTTIEKAKAQHISIDEANEQMTECIMQLKANAPMFGYDLVGQLAGIMLNFLESLKTLDKEAIDIVSAHHKTLSIIINKNMKGDGGEIGKKFQQELQKACARYYKRNTT